MDAFGEDDELVLGEELIHQVDGGVEVAARVTAQVEDERFHTLALQLAEGFLELLRRLLCKAVEFDVTDMIVEHICRIDAVQRNLVADDFKIQQFRVVAAFHAHSDFGAFLAAQVFLDIFVIHLFAKAILAVDLDELVSSHNAHFLRGATGRGTDDGNGIADELEGHADTFEAAHKWFVGFLHVLF